MTKDFHYNKRVCDDVVAITTKREIGIMMLDSLEELKNFTLTTRRNRKKDEVNSNKVRVYFR